MQRKLDFGIQGKEKFLFMGSTFFSLLCIVFTINYYENKSSINFLTWSTWVISIVLFGSGFLYKKFKTERIKIVLKKENVYLYLSLTALFFITHFWNYTTAPWNQNGLFDDAAWDIFFSKNHVFSGVPFQIAYFDKLGQISREVIFHYYITFFFKCFGYNLLIFNISLSILGYITFIFTAKLIQKMFKNKILTFISALIMNFLPFWFVQIFAGHRYSITAPLIMISFYFVFSGFEGEKVEWRVGLGGIFAGLAVESALMGRQYIMVLFISGVLLFLFDFKKIYTKKNLECGKIFLFSLIITTIPLIIYISYDSIYFIREKSLSAEFFNTFNGQPFEIFKKNYIDRLFNVFFAKVSYDRWFTPEQRTLPYTYILFIIGGLILALKKKNFVVVLMSLVPILGAFVSGAIDMRFLHAVPFWSIAIAYSLNEIRCIFEKKDIKNNTARKILVIFSALLFIEGLIPCIIYLHSISNKPNSVRLLPHKDVGIARFVRDICAGVKEPSTKMRWNEFTPLKGTIDPEYDTLLCQSTGYAITHLYLQEYEDNKVLSFSNQLPSNLLSEVELFNINKQVIQKYQVGEKSLKLIWEETPNTRRIIGKFKKVEHLGKGEVVKLQIDGQPFSLYILTIDKNNLLEFKKRIKDL